MSTASTPPAPRRHSLLSGAWAWLLATINDIIVVINIISTSTFTTT